MSEFDNPFASPFEDPSVKAVQQNPVGPVTQPEFNPFAGQPAPPAALDARVGTTYGSGNNSRPAQLQPSNQNNGFEASRPADSSKSAVDELQRRQDELERRASELDRRERELQRNVQVQERRNNFPPLPSFCPVQPCFYQDISVDIPLEFQKVVHRIYYVWIAYCGLLLLNVVGSLIYFIVSANKSFSNSSGVTFGLSILYLAIFTPCSFVCWFRPAYNAFRNDSSFNFFIFFFIFFFQFCVCIIQCLGIKSWGTVGIISSLEMFNAGGGGTFAAMIMFIIGVLFGCAAAIELFMLIKVHRIYRSTGASFAKAQSEFAQGVMSNRTVRDTAGNIAASAARSSASQ